LDSLCQNCHDTDNFVHRFISPKTILGSLLAVWITFNASFVFARPPTESEFNAATLSAEEVALFFEKLEKKPSNVAIFDVKVNHPLDPSFAEAVEGEVVRVLKESKAISLINCSECRAARLEVRNDKLVIRKGITDQATMKDLAKELGVDSFLRLEIFRTRFTLITQITLQQASDGQILGSHQIKIPALDWSDAGMLVLLSVGPSVVSGGTGDAGGSSGNFHFGAHVGVLEEVGFGKAGLIVGGAGGPSGGLGYVVPTLGWRGRFGSYGVYSLRSLGIGFGYSDDTGGIALRGSYNVMLGTFTTVGVDAVALVPLQRQAERNPINFAATLFIGISLGR
jgi:hypothetical protein